VEKVTRERINKMIRELKNNKAMDPTGMCAEHNIIKLADPVSVATDIITTITNRVLESQAIPDSLKLGIITPIHKKQKLHENAVFIVLQ
jgi:hypothetical protein